MKTLLLIFFMAPAAFAYEPQFRVGDIRIDQNFQNVAAEIKNISNDSIVTSSAEITGDAVISGSATFLGSVTFTPSSASSITFTCPSGFTIIQNKGIQSGCIQTAEEGSKGWLAASTQCYVNYGGILPPVDILINAFAYYSLTDENDDDEITSPFYSSGGTYYYNTIDGDASPLWGAQAVDTVKAFRCWIPR